MTTNEQRRKSVGSSYCADSPTGAHHWVLEAPSATITGECKYCHEERAFSPFEERVGFNNAPKRRQSGSATSQSSLTST